MIINRENKEISCISIFSQQTYSVFKYLSTSALEQINFLFSSYVLAIFLAQYSQFTNNSYAYIVFC